MNTPRFQMGARVAFDGSPELGTVTRVEGDIVYVRWDVTNVKEDGANSGTLPTG